MTTTTLTGEFHMSEVETVQQHPLDGHWHFLPDMMRESLWPSVIAYADKHDEPRCDSFRDDSYSPYCHPYWIRWRGFMPWKDWQLCEHLETPIWDMRSCEWFAYHFNRHAADAERGKA